MRGRMAFSALLLTAILAGCHAPTPPSDEGGMLHGSLFASANMPAGSPRPQYVGDCSTLLGVLNERAIAEADVALEQALNGTGFNSPAAHRGVMGAVVLAAGDAVTAGGPVPSAADADVTGTNNQEAGVDEADFIKTDGEWTYVLRGTMLYVLRSTTIGDIQEHSRIALNNTTQGGQLLLEPRDPDDAADDRLIIIRQGWEAFDHAAGMGASLIWPYYGAQSTHIQVVSLADRTTLEVLDELWIQGSVMGARLIDGYAYVVVHDHQRDLALRTHVHPTEAELEAWDMTWESYWDLPEQARRAFWNSTAEVARAENRALVANATLIDHLPAVHRATADGGRHEVPITDETCRRFLATEGATGRSVSTIVAIAVDSDDVATSFTQIVGGSPIVYGAQDALVLAAPSRDSWWFWSEPDLDEATDLQWFTLDGLDVDLHASGRVPGIVQDSFGIDVHGDQLRIATTTGTWNRWWVPVETREPMVNHVAVFGAAAEQLLPLGAVGGIAPDERLWSARFTDDRAYLVTFEQIDPLWVIDLSEPSLPRILGELEIPGVSTYIHPLSDDLLLTIGYGPGPDGEGLDWGRVQVSLFDISDPTRPSRAALLDVAPSSGWASSGATDEHKAFTYWDRLGVLAIPLSWHRGDGSYEDRHVGVRLIDVDMAAKELRTRGDVDQDLLYNTTGSHYWWGDVERTYFLGFPEDGDVSVYAISGRGVTAHDLETLQMQDHVRFAHEQYYSLY